MPAFITRRKFFKHNKPSIEVFEKKISSYRRIAIYDTPRIDRIIQNLDTREVFVQKLLMNT